MRALLIKRAIHNYGALIKPETTEMVIAYLNEFVATCADFGFSSAEVPDVFHAYERVRRWGGSNHRKLSPIGDLFSPFCTRLFVNAAFNMSAGRRFLESLHYQLMSQLRPDLHRLPFARRDWLPQSLPAYIGWMVSQTISRRLLRRSRPALDTAQTSTEITKAFDQSSQLEVQREYLRDYCLSWHDSVIWQFVDREVFERVMSSDSLHMARRKHLSGLYSVVTLFYYFHPADSFGS
jgi:asparagine synthase (glutamine-hydrolysing)